MAEQGDGDAAKTPFAERHQPRRAGASRRTTAGHRSSATSSRGCSGGWSALPSADASTGSGCTRPTRRHGLSPQLWHTPVRHDQRTGTSQASASSRRLPYSGLHGTARLLRRTGLSARSRFGRRVGEAIRDGVSAMPGVWPGAGPKSPMWMQPGVDPDRGAVPALFPHERCRATEVCIGASRSLSSSEARMPGTGRRARRSRALGSSRPGRLNGDMSFRTLGREARMARDSSAKGWSRRLRAPVTATRSPARNSPAPSACSMASWGRPDARADQGAARRRLVAAEDEGAARCRDLEFGRRPRSAAVQITAAGPSGSRLTLIRSAVAAGRFPKRIVAQERRSWPRA